MRGLMITTLCISCLLSLNVVQCFDFWNASSTNVTLPSRLIIDSERNILIVAANNSICHLSADLTEQFNVLSAEPDPTKSDRCNNELFEPVENCQNYPHVLTLLSGSDNISSRNGTMYPITDTVLLCGSNALSPQCEYRHRETLEVLSFRDGFGFCPYKYNTGTISMLISSGQLVSATPTSSQGSDFRISISDSPYTGHVAVTTLPSNDNWFYNSPTFVSMHEVGDYIYVFFQEEALEAQEKVLYSRVARVCKNDTGSSELGGISDPNIFTTFVKARISCTSGTGASSDIPFHYNEIQDTFFIPSGSPEGAVGSEEQLFAVFNSARNGPIGSAVCVFTFNAQGDSNIATVYNGDYLKQISQQWVTERNYQPFTCAPGSRSLEDARDIQLMKETVASSNGPRPLLASEEYLFDKIVVSQVKALDNRTYDIVFIAAQSSEDLVVMKASLSQGQEYHVIHSEVLGRPTHISEMQLSENGHIYLTTDDGVYGLPVENCSAYTDCCSCVAARDPFCAYDVSSDMCVSVLSASSDSIQDVTSGNTAYCQSNCEEVVTTQPTAQPTTVECVQSTSESTSTTSAPTFASDAPSIGGIENSNSTPLQDHTWTIVGAVVGFVGGVFVGMLVTAFFFRRSNILRHAKNERTRRRRRRDVEDHGNERKSFTNHDSRTTNGGSSANIPKPDEYMKNNNVRPNEYTAVHSSKSSPRCASKFSATYPSLHESCGSHVTGPVPVHVPPPTPPHKKTVSTFSFDNPPSNPPRYSSVAPQTRSDPNLKSNLRVEEPINNRQRAVYGPNILTRAPSIDAAKHSKYSKATLPVVSPTLRFSTQHPEFVKVSDVETGCSHC